LEIKITADSFTRAEKLVTYEGYVVATRGPLRLQTDRLIYNETTEEAEAVGNVIFDYQGQRITGNRARFSFRTGLGSIWDATGFTDRTPDGTTIYFEARRLDRIEENAYVIQGGRVTACQGTTPTWSFTSGRLELRPQQRVSVTSPAFRVKTVPLLWLPYASVPINKRDRGSGVLLPGFSNSNIRGITINLPYYQTLGRSADITPRVDIYTNRGVGVGVDFRARPDARSHLNSGFFFVKDRVFGGPGDDQGGTAFYVDAVQYLPRGFMAVADVNIVSSFAFRQVFSDSFQEAISPEERTQIYVDNNFGPYSFSGLIQKREVFLSRELFQRPDLFNPEGSVAIRQLPSFRFDRRPERLGRAPIYFSFGASADGVSRKEATLRTPAFVGRLDVSPKLTVPLPSLGGLAITPSLAVRGTFYTHQADPFDRTLILKDNFVRRYLEFTVDVRPPGLERVFHHRDGSRWFKHLVEPYLTYRRITGIGSDFASIIRFDEVDAVADTSEVEYGLINRFFVTRPGEEDQSPTAHELVTIKIAQKYFFDRDFGGALRPDRRNQFYPLNTLSGFSFNAFSPSESLRRFSPVHFAARLRPLSSLFADVRLDYETQRRAVRDVSLGGGIIRKYFSIGQAWYFARPIRLASGLPAAETFSGNIHQSSFTLGDRTRGVFGGFDLAYDFENQFQGRRRGRVLSSTVMIGYTGDCFSLQLQNTVFRVGLRNENRFAVSLTLNGIGSFGKHTRGGQQIINP
jgi:LPS-assembly protein